MKKFLLTICIAAFAAFGAMAQKGQNGVGINLGVAPVVESGWDVCNFGLGIKYQYNITDPIRLEADFNYYFSDKSTSFLDITANVQYLFHINSRFNLYPTVGLGWGNIHQNHNYSRFVFQIGVGAEYQIARNFSADFEFKYQYVKDFQRLPIQIGFNYKF